MEELTRLTPIEAAEEFIMRYFPLCDGAILAGSVVRGEWTPTSDLDIIILEKNQPSAYRESLFEFGWAIEVFVHNFSSYQSFFKSDCERARPSLPRMVSEGMILRDNALVKKAKAEANALLEKGPEKWSQETLKTKHYFITDALEDFIGVTNRAEEIMIANTLLELVSEFVLRTNGRWIGASKWVSRELNHFDERFAKRFFEVFDDFYRTGNKEKVISLVDEVLEPYGGRFFAGYSLGKLQK